MPSPSRIPLASKLPLKKQSKNKSTKNEAGVSKPENNKITKKSGSKPSNSTKQVKPSANSCNPTLSNNSVESQGRRKNVADRRGISEIKRYGTGSM